MSRPVVLLTDFGLVDDFAGVCDGVIAAAAPQSRVIHLTHGITPQFVVQGALVLRNTLGYLPTGAIHMAVVDPGVGTDRIPLAVDCEDGRSFVGPDNGLLAPAIEASGGAVRAVALDNPEFQLQPVAPTFHGRDIFAPAAAHLAAGGDLADLGTAVDHDALVSLEIPEPRTERGAVEADVWNVDRFGNVALVLDRATLLTAMDGAAEVEVVIGKDRYYATVADTFASVRIGEILVYEDPYGWISVAVNQGHAADMFRVVPGKRMLIRAR